MPQKLSREIMRRHNLCELVLGSLRNQGTLVAEALAGIFDLRLQEGEVAPDYNLHLELCGREISWRRDHMEDADEEHRRQLVQYAEIRGRRGRLLDSLKSRFLDLRSICRGLLGEESLGPLGLDFHLAQDAKGMLRQAEILVERLRRPGVELASPTWEVVPPEPEALARSFDGDIAAMRQTLLDLVDQRRKLDVLVLDKQNAIREFDEHFLPVAQWLEASFRVAGRQDLADRIRPTVRRLTRNDDDEKAPAEESPEESATEESPEERAAEPSAETAGESAPERDSTTA